MYQWLAVVHLVGLVVFAVCHGVSAFVAFRIRGSRDRTLVLELLALSQRGNQFAYVGLLLLIVGGIGAGAQSGVLTTTWVLATGAVLIAVLVAMFAIASGYYYPLRRRLGEDAPDASAPLSGDALAAALQTRRPDLLAAIGFGGLIVMIGLMVFKPA
jgi:hypothetical protein